MTKELSPKQVNAISLFMLGRTAVEIADQLGVTPQTLAKWKHQPEFKALLNKCKMETLHDARQRLQIAADMAVDSLVEIATNSENEEIQRKACMDIIKLVGLSDPSSGLFGWGIGATTEQGIREDEIKEQYIRNLTTPDYIFDYRKRSHATSS